MKQYREVLLGQYDDERLEQCILEFSNQDFNDMTKIHSTLMMYQITKELLLTVGVEGYIKKRIITLVDTIGQTRSIDFIKIDFFNAVIK